MRDFHSVISAQAGVKEAGGLLLLDRSDHLLDADRGGCIHAKAIVSRCCTGGAGDDTKRAPGRGAGSGESERRRSAFSVHEGGYSLRYLERPQWPEAERPAPVQVLHQFVRDTTSIKFNLVPFCALIPRRSLKRRIQPVATVVDRPDREPVGHRTGCRGKLLVATHQGRIGSCGLALETGLGARVSPGANADSPLPGVEGASQPCYWSVRPLRLERRHGPVKPSCLHQRVATSQDCR